MVLEHEPIEESNAKKNTMEEPAVIEIGKMNRARKNHVQVRNFLTGVILKISIVTLYQNNSDFN